MASPRLRVGMVVFAMVMAGSMFLFALSVCGVGRPDGKPIGIDFVAYWAAARLALQGQWQALYDNTVIEAFERAHVTLSGPGYLAFYYPPPFLLLCLPLALLPYVAALFVFIGAQAALLWTALRRILPGTEFVLPIVAFPGFVINAFSGQNGGLTASCFAGAMIFLDSRPLLGGACLGALVYKPQMALAVPVALLAARRFRATAAAAGTAGGLCVLSYVAMGAGPWRGFLTNAGAARGDLEHLAQKWRMMDSFYADVRLSGGSLSVGYGGQILLAAVALMILVVLCWRRPGAAPEGAALAATALLVTPFLYDYDFVVLAGPLAWLTASAARGGLLRGEAVLLPILYLLPLASIAVRFGFGVPLAPLFVLIALLLILRRVKFGTRAIAA
jgi:alpha-1,2-mannosyltransferase